MKLLCVFLLAVFLPMQSHAESWSVIFNDYVISVNEDVVGESLEIKQRGEVIYSKSDQGIWLSNSEEKYSDITPNIVDINDDGVPDLLISRWSGGAHCCFQTMVFSLGDTFAVIAEINGRHLEPKLLQLDNDPAMEFKVIDWEFAYWPTSFAYSPSASVVLDWVDGAFVPSVELTDSLQPKYGDLELMAKNLRESENWQSRSEIVLQDVFQQALDLVYLGEKQKASKFIAAAWGGSNESLASHSLEFGRLLERSQYLKHIEAARRDKKRKQAE